MSMKIVSIALLLVSVCLCTPARHIARGIVPLCCTKVSSADVSAQVTGQPHHQKAQGSCVEALIFSTPKGKVCVDPKAPWVQDFKKK
ncbi:C-C motif chemokine 4 homolog isoform X2 [Toxotes jaculatrix]|uniref:C-C motif chemokine 4 homolog isoform X2 n=1 Tax=Toxotes jaculatrix TaxID=941984 RepID=UPI001B3ACAA3|nr:C-C motif chemokine 4 homolog isoform X2 [Toxotes jaculatrix]